MRYIWDLYPQYQSSAGRFAKIAFPGIAHRLRTWDVTSAARVDQFLANSSFVAKRIDKYYRRSSEIVFPPVATEDFRIVDESERGDYFLAAGEFVRYKRFDIVVDAFNELGLRLKVIGDGEERKALERTAGDNIEFLGRVPFSQLKHHFARCRALIFPGEEDFGMVPVEVMASGRPVIAYARGGALDTVVDGLSGVHVHEQSVDAFIDAVRNFKDEDFDPARVRAHSETFGREPFKQRVRQILAQNGIG